jgi:hypothetical protein
LKKFIGIHSAPRGSLPLGLRPLTVCARQDVNLFFTGHVSSQFFDLKNEIGCFFAQIGDEMAILAVCFFAGVIGTDQERVYFFLQFFGEFRLFRQFFGTVDMIDDVLDHGLLLLKDRADFVRLFRKHIPCLPTNSPFLKIFEFLIHIISSKSCAKICPVIFENRKLVMGNGFRGYFCFAAVENEQVLNRICKNVFTDWYD